jgi:hypothetical protein
VDGAYTVHFCYLGTELIHLLGTVHMQVEETFEDAIFGRHIYTLDIHHHIFGQLG